MAIVDAYFKYIITILCLYVVTYLGCGGMDWWMYLLTTYTRHSELQVITALSLISTLYKSPQLPLSLFPACSVFNSRSLATANNSGDSSASRAQVLLSQPPVQSSCQLSTDNCLGPRLATISHQPPSILFTGWLSTELSRSPTSYFTSLHSTEP
jgi:hypothetical protein